MMLEAMKTYLREHNMTHLVRELVAGGIDSDQAIKLVYDQHTMDRETFIAKYFGRAVAEMDKRMSKKEA